MSRIFIYGGCVTRDAFAYLDNHRLVDYVARQSLISSANGASSGLCESQLSSKFQNKCVDGDAKSSLFSAIRRRANDFDLFVMDILSERLGVFSLPDGSFLTNSRELADSGRLSNVNTDLVKFGTDRHFQLWKSAFNKFIRVSDSMNILRKILLVKAPWASYLDTGSKTPSFRGLSALEGNALFERYYKHAESVGLRIIEIPHWLVVGAAEHRWGPAPYHYVPQTYEWLKDRYEEASEGVF